MTKLNISYDAAVALYQRAEAALQTEGADAPMWREVAEGLRNACQIIPTWEAHGACVRVAGPGWMVSYKENPSDSDEPETALIDRRADQFYMLQGDHRQAYVTAASGGWEALFAVYDSLKEQHAHNV